MMLNLNCVRYSVFFLSFPMWLTGCAVLGFMLLSLTQSSEIRRNFFEGTTIFSYVVIGIGVMIFLSGILGLIGSYGKGSRVMKLVLLVEVLTVAAEFIILIFVILNLEMADVFKNGWKEVNGNTKNIIQYRLHCCGFLGPSDYSFEAEPFPNSCFTKSIPGKSYFVREYEIKKIGCKKMLLKWFYKNKPIWIGTLVGILLFQVASVLFAVLLIKELGLSRRSSSESLVERTDPIQSSELLLFCPLMEYIL